MLSKYIGFVSFPWFANDKLKQECGNPAASHWPPHDSPAGLALTLRCSSCLKSRITGNTDSPSTSAEGAGRNESTACANGFPKYLLTTDNYCAAEIPGSAVSQVLQEMWSDWERYSQTWWLLLLLVLPACLLPWSSSHVQLHICY